MAEIRLENLSKSFNGHDVIRDVSLKVADGEFCVFVGPSGCGKSTLLRLIAGLEEATSGKILISGEDVTRLEPYDRQLAMVFQSYALYPHMSVRDNIAFALRTARVREDLISAKVAEAARILRLESYLDRKPAALSGGQRQRVAIGRAIVREPRAFLFDEPLSNLDAALRTDTRVEIAALHRSLHATTIYVTHDQTEAMTLADRIVVLKDGRVMQTGSPEELYKKPSSVFVAQFLGSPKMNILDASVEADAIRIEGQCAISTSARLPTQACKLGLRPEALSIVEPGTSVLGGTVLFSEYHGATRMVVVDIGLNRQLTLQLPAHQRVTPGENIGLSVSQDTLHLFSEDGSTRLF